MNDLITEIKWRSYKCMAKAIFDCLKRIRQFIDFAKNVGQVGLDICWQGIYNGGKFVYRFGNFPNGELEFDEGEPVQGAIPDEHGQRWVVRGDGGHGGRLSVDLCLLHGYKKTEKWQLGNENSTKATSQQEEKILKITRHGKITRKSG